MEESMSAYLIKSSGRLATTLAVSALFLTAACGPGIPIKFPQFPDGTAGTRLKQTLDGKKRVAVVAKEIPPAIQRSMRAGLAEEWSDTIRASMKSALEDYGYYTILDVDSRNARYNELARSQTGLTNYQLSIGQELQVDHLFFVNMTALPRVECKTEMVTDSVAAASAALQLAMAANGRDVKMSNQSTTRPTGVLYLTVFVEGKLVNVETGRSVSTSTTEPFKLQNQAGNPECPSELQAFDGALKQAAKKIADKLSPKVMTFKLPIEDGVDDVKGGDKKLVQQYLADGISWVEAGDMEQAVKSWEMAVDESGGSSSAAFWNLAIAKFAAGDVQEADQLFQRAFQAGGPKFMDGSKRTTYALFKKEKQRIEEEQ